jgi:hypothetical protein
MFLQRNFVFLVGWGVRELLEILVLLQGEVEKDYGRNEI